MNEVNPGSEVWRGTPLQSLTSVIHPYRRMNEVNPGFMVFDKWEFISASFFPFIPILLFYRFRLLIVFATLMRWSAIRSESEDSSR